MQVLDGSLHDFIRSLGEYQVQKAEQSLATLRENLKTSVERNEKQK